jgi:lipopolysaccharide export system protein LptA
MRQAHANIWTAALVLACPILACMGGTASAQIDSNSKSPIDITANEAEVINAKCIAIWRGNAEVLQDKSRLRADTITMYRQPKGQGANGQPDCGKTERIEAEGHVFYVSPDQNARSDRAVYTAASDQVVMTGGVIVVQGNDVARGQRLTLNTVTHQAKMEAGDGAGGSGRVRAVIYPDKTTTGAAVSR